MLVGAAAISAPAPCFPAASERRRGSASDARCGPERETPTNAFPDCCIGDRTTISPVPSRCPFRTVGATHVARRPMFVERWASETTGRCCDPDLMIVDRLSDDARKALVGAFREAAGLGHRSVGPEHVLLGFFDEPQGLASRALTPLGVSRDRLREQIAGLTAQQSGAAARRARHTRALNERGRRLLIDAGGLSQGEPVIRADHLLLAMLVEPDDTATHALANLGVEPPAVRAAVARLGDTD